MWIKEVISLLDELRAELVVMLCHHNADPDAVCSAYAFSSLLKRLRPFLSVEVAAAQGPSRLSKRIIEALSIQLVDEPKIEEANAIILMDTNTVRQLGDWEDRVKVVNAPIVVIDHHVKHAETERLAKLYLADEGASSTCEIVYRLFKEADVKPSDVESKALLLGMAFETKHFAIASSFALRAAADLIEAGVNLHEALSTLSMPMEESERIARLKACQRAKLMRVNKWIIALSHVSSYQASAARALIDLGADVAIVAGSSEGLLTISLRCTQDFHERTGVHLGRDVANPLGKLFRGMGGGHSTSAGVNGAGEVEAALKACIELLKKRLGGSIGLL